MHHKYNEANYMYIDIEKKNTVNLLFLDFSKAFYCVNHDLLCKKLELYFGFDSSAIKLLNNYLSERNQYVYVNGISSVLLNWNVMYRKVAC